MLSDCDNLGRTPNAFGYSSPASKNLGNQNANTVNVQKRNSCVEGVCAHVCAGACTCVLIRRPELMLSTSVILYCISFCQGLLTKPGEPHSLARLQPTSPRYASISVSLSVRVTGLRGNCGWLQGG